MTEMVMKAVEDGEEFVVTGQTTSYEALKVPRNFVLIYQDPIYFQQIDATRSAPRGDRPAADAPAAAAPSAEETIAAMPEDAPATPGY
jgi:hypothetical protein